MWNDILVMEEPLAEKVLRAALVYVVVLILIRLFGKRGLATMNLFDLVVALLIAGVVEACRPRRATVEPARPTSK
jgi:uncharacterized membrane protein YcaP (DUF421 family)